MYDGTSPPTSATNWDVVDKTVNFVPVVIGGATTALLISDTDSIAFGETAGATNQGDDAVAFGTNAGSTNQGDNSVAIGTNAGESNQGTQCVAIGYYTGTNYQGDTAIAIGGGVGGVAPEEEDAFLTASPTMNPDLGGATTVDKPVANRGDFGVENITNTDIKQTEPDDNKLF